MNKNERSGLVVRANTDAGLGLQPGRAGEALDVHRYPAVVLPKVVQGQPTTTSDVVRGWML